MIPTHGAHKGPTKDELDVIVALVALWLEGGFVGPIMFPAMRRLLAMLVPTPSDEVLSFVVALSGGHVGAVIASPGSDVGPVEQAVRDAEPAWLALYLVRATERLAAAAAQGPDELRSAESAEVRYSQLQRAASARRAACAREVDRAAQIYADREPEGLLGWAAVIDGRTTPECRWANGRNFDATRPTVIGVPGSVHLRCRCSVRAPIPGAPLIPSA